MSHYDQKIIKPKLGLLELAKQLGSVSVNTGRKMIQIFNMQRMKNDTVS